MLGGPDDTWRTKLVMREIMHPSSACAEIAQSNIRPQFEILHSDPPRDLAGQHQRRGAASHGFSIVGQCLFYHVAEPIIRNLIDESEYSTYDVAKLADACDRFTLAALDAKVAQADQSAGAQAMNWIALKMLTGNQGKYLGIILGIAFAALLMAQQASIFCGLMLQTTSQIRDIQGADIWVMDPNVQFVDDIKPLSDNDLYRVRGVPGVAWAVRLYKGLTRSRLEDGNFQQMILLGLDDATLVGAPPNMMLGSSPTCASPTP